MFQGWAAEDVRTARDLLRDCPRTHDLSRDELMAVPLDGVSPADKSRVVDGIYAELHALIHGSVTDLPGDMSKRDLMALRGWYASANPEFLP